MPPEAGGEVGEHRLAGLGPSSPSTSATSTTLRVSGRTRPARAYRQTKWRVRMHAASVYATSPALTATGSSASIDQNVSLCRQETMYAVPAGIPRGGGSDHPGWPTVLLALVVSIFRLLFDATVTRHPSGTSRSPIQKLWEIFRADPLRWDSRTA